MHIRAGTRFKPWPSFEKNELRAVVWTRCPCFEGRRPVPRIELNSVQWCDQTMVHIYQMVAQNTVRTYGVNQVFRFVKGIWLHRQSRQIRFFSRKRTILLHTCATCSELPSCIITGHQTGFCQGCGFMKQYIH